MAMDVFGSRPKSSVSQVFDCAWVVWGPLWGYCCDVAPEITSKVKFAYTNDWDGLGEDDAEALAAKLRVELEHGRVARVAAVQGIGVFNERLVAAFAAFLEACGGFVLS